MLRAVPDPEIPVISVCELGIVREVRATADAVTVVVTPTYSGCPATEVIATSIRDALPQAGAARSGDRDAAVAGVDHRLDRSRGRGEAARLWHRAARRSRPGGAVGRCASLPRIACPRCGSRRTERLSQFGSTACKALYRCLDCREPFEYFKPI